MGGRLPPQPKGPIDYKSLILRLTAHACRFLGFLQSADTERVIQGTGMSPEDFAIQLVQDYVTRKITYDGSKGMPGLIQLLKTAMEHDMLDALDRSEHKLAEFLDPTTEPSEEGVPAAKSLQDLGEEPDDLPGWLDGEAFKSKVYGLVKDDAQLKEMADAIFEINALKPREIADVCMTTADNIQNRKKRFDRLLQQHGHHAKGAQDEE